MIGALLLILGFSFTIQAQHSLTKKWESEARFKVPESVFFDKTKQVLYVSNIDGTDPWAKDGAGSLGMMGLDGRIIAAEWIGGLNAPKGMAMFEGMLYVADLDQIVIVDPSIGIEVSRITIGSAMGLNDISIDEQGVVYVTDSKGGKLYRVKNGAPSVLLDGLKGPNGVLCHKGQVYLLNDGGLYKVEGDEAKLIADGLEGFTDGIEPVKEGGFIVSCWAGVIYFVDLNGKKELLIDGRQGKINSADIGYDPEKRIVYVPTFWKNSVVAYELK